MKTKLSFFFLLLLSACNQPQKPKPVAPKGELAFLLQYNNRLPGDVGFMTNHIMERRLANLLKENYESFMLEPKTEHPIEVDTVNYVVTARFTAANNQQAVIESVIVDVANDAIWVDYTRPDTVLHYSDRTSIGRPAGK